MGDGDDMNDPSSPFAVDGPAVDGLVFAPGEHHPELGYRPPPVPDRPPPPAPPAPPAVRPARLPGGHPSPWTPGPVREPARRDGDSPFHRALTGLVLLLLLAGLGYLIYTIMAVLRLHP